MITVYACSSPLSEQRRHSDHFEICPLYTTGGAIQSLVVTHRPWIWFVFSCTAGEGWRQGGGRDEGVYSVHDHQAGQPNLHTRGQSVI